MARSLTLKRFRPYVYRVNSCTCAYVDNILEHSVTLESPLIDTSVCCSLYVCVCVVRGDQTTAIVLAVLLATKPRIAQLMGSMTEVLWLCLAGERVFFSLFQDAQINSVAHWTFCCMDIEVSVPVDRVARVWCWLFLLVSSLRICGDLSPPPMRLNGIYREYICTSN